MNPKSLPSGLPAQIRRRPVLWGALALILLIVGWLWLRPSRTDNAAATFYDVRRGDFTVTVVEGGTLAAVSEVSIRNEVEGLTARIISIVPEGSYVKKGDLLVELDSAQAMDQVNQQQIAYEKAKFAVEQARAQLEIQRSATNSDYLAADLKLQFAKIDREKYLAGQRLVEALEANNKVIQASNTLAVNLDTFINSTNLAQKGYETKQKVDGDRLAVLNSHNSLIVATNSLWMLEAFDVPKQLKKYDSDVLQAEQELERVVSQNKRKMAQYEADLSAQINTLELSEQKLDRDKKNLAATRIIAPQDGLVVYQVSENRFSSESLIEGGATVRNRQELIKLPDLSRMKVTVKVHESHVNMVVPGLSAFVILDSMPDVRFRGVVERVAPLPDTQSRWGNPNLKVYNTEIYIADALPNVKPGVSAKAEIVVTNIANAIYVPIQSVTTFKGRQVVYVQSGSKTDPRPVETGLFNTKHIEILKGISEGDRVLLSPPFDTQSRDLEGAVLAADEKARFASTNLARTQGTNSPRSVPAGPGGRNGLGQGPNGAGPGGPGGPGFAGGAAPGAGRDGAANGRGGREGGNREGSGRRGNFNPEEMLKQFDKNGDGELDETEREAMRAAMAARFGQGGPGGGGGGPRMSREEMLKQFDKNGDGELDDNERAAMRESLGSRTNRTERRPRADEGTGAPGSGGTGAPGGGAPGAGAPGAGRGDGPGRPESSR
jgi:HlyD family secretion protein